MSSFFNRKYENLCVTEHYLTRSKDVFILLDVNTLDVFILDETEGNIIKALNNNKCTAEKGIGFLAEEYGESFVTGKIDEFFLNGILIKKETKVESNANIQTCKRIPREL